MTALLILLILGAALFTWSLCVVAARADEIAELQFALEHERATPAHQPPMQWMNVPPEDWQ